MARPRQLELIPSVTMNAAERRAWINERLRGLHIRQAARAQLRVEKSELRKARQAADVQATARQVTLEEMIASAPQS